MGELLAQGGDGLCRRVEVALCQRLPGVLGVLALRGLAPSLPQSRLARGSAVVAQRPELVLCLGQAGQRLFPGERALAQVAEGLVQLSQQRLLLVPVHALGGGDLLAHLFQARDLLLDRCLLGLPLGNARVLRVGEGQSKHEQDEQHGGDPRLAGGKAEAERASRVGPSGGGPCGGTLAQCDLGWDGKGALFDLDRGRQAVTEAQARVAAARDVHRRAGSEGGDGESR